MTDLALIDEYLSNPFVNPKLLREITNSGLYDVVNFIDGNNTNERKANARARLAKKSKYIGDPEITWFADNIDRLEFLRKELNNIPMTESNQVLKILNEMIEISNIINNYYKK